MLLDSSAERDLLANLRASRAGKLQLRSISLDSDHLRTRSRRPDVDHEHLVLCQFSDLGLLAVGGLYTQQPPEQEVVDFKLRVDLRQLALQTEDEADETVGTAESRVNAGTDTDQTTGHGELERVVFGEERDDAREDGLALDLAFVVFADDTGTDFDLVAELQDTSEDGATGDTTLELVNLGTRLVDVEGTDDNEVWVILEVAHRDRDLRNKHLVDSVDVELKLGGDRDDGGVVGDRAADELLYRLVVRGCGLFSHQVDLVLENDDVAELHDLDGCKMLGGLRLRAGFVACNEEERGIHDCGT